MNHVVSCFEIEHHGIEDRGIRESEIVVAVDVLVGNEMDEYLEAMTMDAELDTVLIVLA